MYSKKANKLMISTIKNVHFWSCGPLKWNERAGRVESERGRFRRALWFVNFLIICTHWIFLLFRYIQYNFVYESAPAGLKVYTEYAVLSYSFPVVLHVYMYLREEGLVSCLNNYMRFYGRIPGKLEVDAKVGKECDGLLMFLLRAGQVICWANLIVMFRKPARPILITSLLENPAQLRAWEIFPYSIPHIIVWWTMWANMHLYGVHLITYISGTITTIGALKEIPQTEPTAIHKFAKTYTSLQVMHTKFDVAYGRVLPAYKVTFVLLIIRSMYGAFAPSGSRELRILQGIVGSTAWFFLQAAFKTIGGVHETCTDMLPEWRSLRDPWFRRVLKSCRNLRVEIAGMYYVDKELSLTLALFILDSIVSMLLA